MVITLLKKISAHDLSQMLINQNPDYEVLIISNIGSKAKYSTRGIAKGFPQMFYFSQEQQHRKIFLKVSNWI